MLIGLFNENKIMESKIYKCHCFSIQKRFISKQLQKLVFLLLFLSFIIINNKKYFFSENKIISVCLCTLGKEENKYVREYINHYLEYGVNKIFIYDNNDINGESFNNVIEDYIQTNYVEILNYRGIKKVQLKAMNHCYNNNFMKYNWLIFYDMDEYIYLNHYYNINQFLNKPIFNKCHYIRLNNVYHTDSNNLYYINKSLSKRFPEIIRNMKKNLIKTILRGNITGIKISNVHWLSKNKKIKACDGFGNIVKKITTYADKVDQKNYYINHYSFKSTEEFISKIIRGSAVYGLKVRMVIKIRFYFNYNKITLDKINLIEKRTRLNLDEYRNKLKDH